MIAQLGLVVRAVASRPEDGALDRGGAVHCATPALTGVTMSFVLLAYTLESVASTFAIAAAMFGAMALYGTVTSRSLAGWGQFLFMGLIGVVIASVVGMFWQNDGLQFVLGFMRRDRLHRSHGVRRAAPQGDGPRAAFRCHRQPTPSSAR